LPAGWMLITEDFPFELNPNETDTKLVSFFVPQTAMAGEYEITYIIKDKKYPEIRDVSTAYVTVLPVSKLEARLLESPDYVIAGEDYKASFIVTNLGNTEYNITAKLTSSENLPFVVDSEKFTLAPGQSKTIAVKVKTDAKITKRLKHSLRLAAQAVGDSKVEAKTQSSAAVDILPRISGTKDDYHRIPAEVILRYVSQTNQDSKSGFQTEFRGEGTLDEQGKKNVRFGFKGPDIQNKSVLGERDEYYASYWTDDYELHLGDRSFSLSSLTENYLYGRGVEGRLNIDKEHSAGIYHMKTRWLEPATEETAAYMNYMLDEKHRLGLNYLRKTRNGDTSDITSLSGEFELSPGTQLELEYALGPGGNAKDNAYLAWLHGYNNLISYYLKLTHAGPDYPGYYSDLDYIAGGVALPINKHLRLNASFRREKNNLDLDPTFFSAPLEKYYQFGADYRLETDTTFSFDWFSRNRKDRLDTPEFDYREKTFRVGVSQVIDKMTFYTSAELGKVENKLTDTAPDSERYTASLYFRPNKNQSYSGYLYYDKNADFTGNNRQSTTIGLNADYRIADRTFLGFAFQTNDFQNSSGGDRDNLEMRLSHTFINNNTLSLTARRTIYGGSDLDNDTALLAQYTIPLGLPVHKKTSIGSIKGHVFDQQTQDALGNVILRLNDSTAVTDGGGNFVFPSVRPGICFLNVETASIGLNRIPAQKTPIELTVQGGEKTIVEIPVTQAARLEGQVIVCASADSARTDGKSKDSYIVGAGDKTAVPIADYGLENTIAELKSASEIKRTVTDRQGRFEFEEVRPGEWTLKIYADNLPEYHYLEKDTFELKLEPGQKANVSVKILPKKRRIRIIDEQKTLIEEKKR